MNLKHAFAALAVAGLMCLHAIGQVTVSTTATTASYQEPYNVVEDSAGDVFISDSVNNRIIRIDAITSAASVLAGITGVQGTNDGPASGPNPAQFNDPEGLLVINIGGTSGLLVTDSGNNLIRFVRFSDGYVTTIAGQNHGATNGDTNEIGANATFNTPVGMDQDANGNVYIADTKHNAIRIINLQDPLFGVTNLVLLDGTTFSQPNALAFVGTNQLWVADSLNNAVKLITLSSPTTGRQTTYVGINASRENVNYADALFGPSARFNKPSGLLWIPNVGLLISDTANSLLRLATAYPANGATNYAVSTYAGMPGTAGAANGSALSATFNQPEGLCLDPNNGAFLVADLGNNFIRSLKYTVPRPLIPSGLTATPSYGAITLAWNPSLNATTYNLKRSATSGGPYTEVGNASGTNFVDITVTSGATYYYVVSGLNAGGESANSSEVSATVPQPPLNNPQGIAFDSQHNSLLIADYGSSSIELLNLHNNSTSTFQSAAAGIMNPVSVLLDTNENVYVLNQGTAGHGSVLKFDISGNAYGPIVTGLNQPTAFTMDSHGTLFVAEQGGNIRAFGTGISNLVATITTANVSLQGIVLFDDGTIAVSDAGNQVIWSVNSITKLVTQLTGQLGVSGATVGASSFARLSQPQQLARVGANQIIAADSGNSRLVLIQRDGTVSTNNFNSAAASIWFGQAGDPVASGSPRFVSMISPKGIALGNGGEVFVSETFNNDIRGLTGTAITSPTFNPGVSLPYFGAPQGLAFDNANNSLYIADFANNAVQQLNLNNNSTTTFLSQTSGLLHPSSVLLDPNNNVYVLNQNTGANGTIVEFDPYGNRLATNVTGLTQPTAFTRDGNGNIFIAELAGAIKVLFPSGAMSTLVTLTNNVQLQGIAAFDDGVLAVSDSANQVIWTVNPTTKLVSLLTGQLGVTGTTLGAANVALLNQPHQLARAGNNQLLIADYGNNRLVTASRAGAITNVLASASQLWLGRPTDPTPGATVAMAGPAGVAVSASGQVFDSEPADALIRSLTATVTAPPAAAPVVSLPLFAAPLGLAFDSADNFLFVADQANNAVQRLNLNNNSTATFLSQTNGLLKPASVLLDTNNNLYVLNQNSGANGAILKFDIAGNPFGQIITGLNQPTAFTMDGYGTLFVAEKGGNVRAFLNGVGQVVATITNANVSLQGIALFDDGTIAVSDAGNQVIWAINPITKRVSRLTGQLGASGSAVGLASFASFAQPQQLIRVGGNQIVAADSGNNRLVLIQNNGTVVTNFNSAVGNIWFGQAGDPVASGSLRSVPMVSPVGLAVGSGGEIFASETYYNDIRGLTGTGLSSPTFNPGVSLPYFGAPQGLAFDNANNSLYIADFANNAVQQLNLNNNSTTTFLSQTSGLLHPSSVLLDPNNNVYVLNQNTGANGTIVEFDPYGNRLATNVTGLTQPTAFTRDGNGNIFIAELAGAIKVLFPSGAMSTLVTLTNNVQLQGIAAFDDGVLAVSDSANQVIWTVNPTTKLVSLLTGQLGVTGTTLGAANVALLNQPHQLARAGNNQLLIADYGNNRLVTASRAGDITNVLDSTSQIWLGRPTDPALGTAVAMTGPAGVAISASGQVFDSEPADALIRSLTATVAAPPLTSPIVNLPVFPAPQGIAFDSMDNLLFIADSGNGTVQRLNLNNNSTTTFLGQNNGLLNPVSVLLDAANRLYVLDQKAGTNGTILKFGLTGNAFGPMVMGLNQPTAFTMDGEGTLIVAEKSGNIRAFGTGISNLVATITNANVSLQGIALFDDGTIAVSDAGNQVIWTVNPITKLVSQLTGQLGVSGAAVGVASFASLAQPNQLLRVGGNQIVAADTGNNRLVLIQRDGTVITNNPTYQLNSSVGNIWFGQAGDPVANGSARFVSMVAPVGLALGNGGEIFTSETYYDDIRGLTGTGITSPTSNPGVPLPYFGAPQGIAFDNIHNSLYIADFANSAVQVLNLNNNATTTVLPQTAGILHPAAVLMDTSNNLYVLNQNTGADGTIVEFDPFGNRLATNVTGLNLPTAFTMDGNGNIFIAELTGAIKVLFPSGTLRTLVTLTNNVQLQGIAAFDDGVLAVSDSANQVIWTVNPSTKLVSQLTGQLGATGTTLGAANVAELNQPHQLARAGNNQLLIADYGNNRLVTATRAGAITTVLASVNSQIWLGRATDPTLGTAVAMTGPAGVAVSASGQVFDSEPAEAILRGLTATVTAPPATPPVVSLPLFAAPQGLAFDPVDNSLFIADQAKNAVQRLNLNNNSTTTFLGQANNLNSPVSVLLDTNNDLYVLNQNSGGANGSILKFDLAGNAFGQIVTGLNQPTAFTMDGYGTLFVTEQGGKIRTFLNGVPTVVATITNAGVSLQGIALFDDGTIAVSDAGNEVIWTINPITKLVSQLTGQLGASGSGVGLASFAGLSQPNQLVRVGGNQIVAADTGNNRLVLIQRNGTVVTNSPTYQLNSSIGSIWFGQAGDPVASGSLRSVPMVSPVGLALGNGGELFASETYYADIRGLTGTGLSAPSPVDVPLPYYASPAGIALNNEGTVLYVTDSTNNKVSTLNLANNRTTLFLNASNHLVYPVDVALDGSDNVYVLNQGTGNNGFVLEFDRFGNLLNTNVTGLAYPTAMTFDNSGNILVAEQAGAVQEFAAGAPASATTLATVTNAGVQLQGIALFNDGTIVLSDAANHVLWQLDPITKAASLFTGQLGSPGSTLGSPSFAQLNQPHQLKLAANNLLVAADSGNNRVVMIGHSGAITNVLDSSNATVWFGLAGDPAAADSAEFVSMVSPIGLAIGTAGGVFASETYYHDVREILGTELKQPVSGENTGGAGTNAIVVSQPIISPNSGYYPMGQSILVQSAASAVYYTTDGTTPTTNSVPVNLTNNIGYIHWSNSTNDLTSLHLIAFLDGTNASVVVSGQPVAAANIGVPTDFNPNLYAGSGSTVVIPVVCNLAPGQQIESYQFRLEIAPVNNPNTPVISPLSIYPGNDFIPLVTAAQSGEIASNSVEAYSLGITNGLTMFAVGAGTHILFHGYAVVALLEVQIPLGANPGDTYALTVLDPSATSDAYNNPVPLTALPTTTIVVTNIPYTVGDSASTMRTWYNAGTFGDDNLDNADVNQAFYAASGLRVPYAFSDAFNAMDVFPVDTAGSVGGDGQIRFLDWVTILERSLRLDPSNWAREWSIGGNLIDFSTNLVESHARTAAVPKAKPLAAPQWPVYYQALLGAESVGNVAPGSTVAVPIYAQMADGASLSGLQFRALVTPQNGAPALSSAPQLATAPGVITPYFNQSFKAGETAFAWLLESFNYSPLSSNYLGSITFTVPTNALAGQTYRVSLLNADGAPNATSQYNFQTRSATVAVNAAAPPATICSDEWKAQYFGSSTNPAAADNADPDGDGVPNWMEFLEGTDPTNAASKLQFTGALATVAKGQPQMQFHLTTALGRAYEVQWNATLNNPGTWTTLSTISGTGNATNCADVGFSHTTRYYRLRVLP